LTILSSALQSAAPHALRAQDHLGHRKAACAARRPDTH